MSTYAMAVCPLSLSTFRNPLEVPEKLALAFLNKPNLFET